MSWVLGTHLNIEGSLEVLSGLKVSAPVPFYLLPAFTQHDSVEHASPLPL